MEKLGNHNSPVSVCEFREVGPLGKGKEEKIKGNIRQFDLEYSYASATLWVVSLLRSS